MLAITDITYTLEGRRLFDGASATIPSGHTVGVVGRNGTGKTTLFRLIRGELVLDGGSIETPKGTRIGGVAQEAPGTQDSLIDTVLAADTERAALLRAAETEADPTRIAEIQARLTDIGAHSAEARAAAILHGLGFDAAAQARACAEFSGGWRMRVALAAVLFSAPDLLLLDEPTNYLDFEGAAWLENFLARYPHGCLIISHDRELLNRSVKGVLHLSEGRLAYYAGGYDDFDARRRARLEQLVGLKKKQDAQRAHIQSFVDRFRYKASKARQAQSRLKMLERMQPIAAISENAVAPFDFGAPAELPPPLITVEGGQIGYDGKPVLSRLNFRIDQDDRIALLGANGEGKSTLSKLIAGRLPLMAGRETRAQKLRVGYFAQHQLDELYEGESPLQHIARRRPDTPPTKLRARLGAGGIGADIADNPVERLSGGQKARLLLLLATLDSPHLLILDEPTNHLDIESRDALVQALNAYSGAVILVSHDSHLVAAVADRLWLVGGGRAAPFDEDIDAYRRLVLSQRGDAGGREGGGEGGEKKRARRSAADLRKRVQPLREEVAACEARVTRLEGMRDKIDAALADQSLYETSSADRIETAHKKRGEILAGLARAETLWMEALERLERAEAEAAENNN